MRILEEILKKQNQTPKPNPTAPTPQEKRIVENSKTSHTGARDSLQSLDSPNSCAGKVGRGATASIERVPVDKERLHQWISYLQLIRGIQTVLSDPGKITTFEHA